MEEYHQITLNEYISIKEDIKRRLNHLAESFVAIGYRLKQIRDTKRTWINKISNKPIHGDQR